MSGHRWFAIATVGNYLLLTILWASILVLYARFRRAAVRDDPLVALLVAVLALDALKNVVENLYFGVLWSGSYGLAFVAAEPILSRPSLLLLPKLLNLAVALTILGVVLARSIPGQIAERRARREAEERLRAELEASLARLRDEEQRWQLAVEASAHGIWDVDVVHRRAWVSPRLEAQLGYPEGTLAGALASDAWLELIHDDERDLFVTLRRAFVAGTIPTFSLEYRLRASDGSWRRIVCRGAASRRPDGRAVRVVGCHDDVTEQRAAEEALAARTRMESLGVLAGGIAHDFNNLLAIIRGNAYLARTQPKARADEALLDLDAAVTRATELTGRLLAYSGRGRFVVGPLDLSAHGRELLRLVAPTIPPNVTIEPSFPDDLHLVEADAAQIQQVFMNLIGNAVDAIGERPGHLRICTESRVVEREVASVVPGSAPSPPGAYVVLEVEDDGVGMSEELRARIFEPFFSSKGSGRGLGLAAMLGILQAHGAALELRSAPGEGSTFTVWFPALAERASASPAPVPRTSLPPGPRRRVLVADDEELLLKLVTTFLTTSGYAVDTAADGRAAIAALEADGPSYCLAILDITMPEPDGRAVLDFVRRTIPELPVILTSGYAQEAAPLDGSTRFLQKPFTAAALRAMIREACPPEE